MSCRIYPPIWINLGDWQGISSHTELIFVAIVGRQNHASLCKIMPSPLKVSILSITLPRIKYDSPPYHSLRTPVAFCEQSLRRAYGTSLAWLMNTTPSNDCDALPTSTRPKKTQRMPINPFLTTSTSEAGHVDEQPFELSQDALIVQTVTADLQRAGVAGDVFRIVQKHGYLRNWDKERWERAEWEVAQAQLFLARQRRNKVCWREWIPVTLSWIRPGIIRTTRWSRVVGDDFTSISEPLKVLVD